MSQKNRDIPGLSWTQKLQEVSHKPKIKSASQYNPLNDTTNEIRLLRLVAGKGSDPIQSIHFHVSLNKPPRYASLSYCWGATENPKQIQLNGANFQVTNNLHAALIRLRSPDEDRIVWIDAICIDQSNIPERDSQVQMMGSIYKKAHKVVVWLGPEGDDSALGASFVHDLNTMPAEDPQWLSRISTDPQYLPCLHALRAILERDYWDRIWVVQEVAFASDIVAYVGGASINWSELSATRNTLYPFLFDVWHGGSFPVNRLSVGGPHDLRIHSMDRHRKKFTALEMLEMHRNKLATDPRDKIIALVGLTEELQGQSLIDYNLSTKELFKKVVKVIVLKTGQIDIIAQPKEDSRDRSLPSWVPDWGRRSYSTSFGMTGYSSGGDSIAVVNFHDDIMAIRAAKLAVIDRVGIDCMWAPDNLGVMDYAAVLRALGDWEKILKQVRGTAEAAMEALIKIVSFDPILQANEEDVLQLDQLLSDFRGHSIKKDDTASTVDHVKPIARVIRLLFALFRTKLIIAGNLFGLGIKDASVGDIVVIPLGCSTPVILRPLNDGYYSLVEGAWMDGFMGGEILPLIEDKTFELEDFKLR